MKKILLQTDKELRDEKKYGGKAANLHILKSRGANVPAFVVVAPHVFDEFLKGNAIEDPKDRDRVMAGKFSNAFLSELKISLAKTGLNGCRLAVRSSAAGEDSKDASFAGQMDTFLFITGTDSILEAIKKCWLSFFSDRINAYREKKGIKAERPEVTVVLQKMVDSEISGVVFTYDTIKNNEDIVINAVFGQGEGLVSGKIEADSYTVSRKGVIKRELIAEKAQKIAFTGGGTGPVDLSPADKERKCLDASMIRRICGRALKLEKIYGYALDIEFAFAGGKFYILQARPVTIPGNSAGRVIWDNSNITESYAGVTTPFTFSFIERMYDIVYRQFASTMGVDKKTIESNSSVFANMLGLINGEVYYNLKNWYRAIKLLPAYEQNRVFMEQMMGVKEKFEETLSVEKQGGLAGKIKIASMAARVLAHYLNVDRTVARFKSNFNRVYSGLENSDFSGLTPAQVMEEYKNMTTGLVWNWQAPIITDFFAMIFYGLLKNLAVKWAGDASGTLQNSLLSGQGGMESIMPVRETIKIALAIKQDEKSMELFSLDDGADVLAGLEKPGNEKISGMIKEYLKNYGYRGINELKLEEPCLADRPEFLIKIIKNYLKIGAKDLLNIEEKENMAKENAEKKMAGAVRGRPVRRMIYGIVLANARKHIKNRESMRLCRSKIYNVVRKMINAVGAAFVKTGELKEMRDVYYLRIEEVEAFSAKGNAASAGELTARRKKEFDHYRKTNDLKERIETTGVFTSVFSGDYNREKAAASGARELKGVACSPGKIKGRVKIILSPDGDVKLDREILVAKKTDPGWVTFYPSISGLIIEKGSILSHSAIVAREMAIPAVVGITGAAELLHDGDIVEVDGTEGIVRLL